MLSLSTTMPGSASTDGRAPTPLEAASSISTVSPMRSCVPRGTTAALSSDGSEERAVGAGEVDDADPLSGRRQLEVVAATVGSCSTRSLSLALPTLEAMLNSHGTAYAQNMPFPKRYVAWFFGNGVLTKRWDPSATGANWALTDQLQPLVDASRGIDVKSYVTVVSGYAVKTPNARGHPAR